MKPAKISKPPTPHVGADLFTMGYDNFDSEKGARTGSVVDGLEERHGKLVAEDGTVPGETFVIGDSFYAKAQRFAARFNIEQRGIERVPEDERADDGFKALLNAGTMVRG